MYDPKTPFSTLLICCCQLEYAHNCRNLNLYVKIMHGLLGSQTWRTGKTFETAWMPEGQKKAAFLASFDMRLEKSWDQLSISACQSVKGTVRLILSAFTL